MPPSLTLIQLNIEGSRHLARVLPFFKEEKPDIVCIQELQEKDIPPIKNALGKTVFHYFIPMLHHVVEGKKEFEGIGIFSQLPFKKRFAHYYTDPQGLENERNDTTTETKRKTQAYVLVGCDIENEGASFRILTTHFTWTPNGQPDDYQRIDLQAMLALLEPLGDFVLTGDFNAPRGGEIFTRLAERFTDTVPPHYTSSIDGTLHRAGPLPYMVDGIFSTPTYSVSNVEMRCGVSDHCALVARIAKN